MQLLLKMNAYFSRFYCNKNLPQLRVFSSFRTGAGLRPKKCGAGAGWDGLLGGCGQNFSNSCGCGAGLHFAVLGGSGQKISTRAGL